MKIAVVCITVFIIIQVIQLLLCNFLKKCGETLLHNVFRGTHPLLTEEELAAELKAYRVNFKERNKK